MKRLLFLFCFLPTSLFAGTLALTYSPANVALEGTLDLQTFPGPPNFESIKSGDEIERHFYLKLDHPITVEASAISSDVENAETERNVKIVQLAVDADDDALWAKLRKLGRGARVKVNGTLFHRFTGHHHSRVLLSVESVSASQ